MMAVMPVAALATALPGPADVSRIRPPAIEPDRPLSARPQRPTVAIVPEEGAPEGAAQIRFMLTEVELKGVTVFPQDELAAVYAPLLCQEIALDKVWGFANQITAYYRDHGYFLSRAYVPEQEIGKGKVVIHVVEGYIGKVVLDDPVAEHRIFRELTEALQGRRPVAVAEVESYLLRLNDLPGKSYRAVVQPYDGAPEGAVAISLVPLDKPGQGLIQFDNASSRYLGPYQALAHYQDSFIPLQQTAVTLSASAPADELKYVGLTHVVPLTPTLSAHFGGNYIHARPGYRLEQFDIRSKYYEFSAGVEYRPVRQWLENLTFTAGLIAKNTRSDAAGFDLTHDSLRKLELGVSYDIVDAWDGYNLLQATVSQGLGILGASGKGSLRASRVDGDPEFTRLELSVSRRQPLGPEWALNGRLDAQVASGALLASEEFGYGGQQFGRAYDPSEITGDHGLAGMLQLVYTAVPEQAGLRLLPFLFYDIGKVWNEDTGGVDVSASSAGFGLYLEHGSGVSGTLTVAQPLTRRIDAPLYGNGSNPRFVFNLGYRF